MIIKPAGYDDLEDFEEVTLVKIFSSEDKKREWFAERGIVLLFGEINQGSARSVISSMWQAALQGKPILLVINSKGGSVHDGLAIYDTMVLLRRAGHTVNTLGIGEVFSMATVVLQGGEKRLITPSTYLMIHEVSSWNWGKLSEQSDTVKYLAELEKRTLGILAERSKLTVAGIRTRYKRKDWWITPEDALKFQLVDAIVTNFAEVVSK